MSHRPQKWKILGWIAQGYSLFKCGNLIKIIELIKANKILFKVLDHLHAKIYVGDTHAILGSANFSKHGLTRQLEANIRVFNDPDNPIEREQYAQISLIANNFYEWGKDFKNGMLDLLYQLFKITVWQEALARAIAELLEGNWFKEFPELYNILNNIDLWPSQKYALGQALYILQNQGCVLIADPTGSGKTKLISTLQLLLFHWLWETGRRDKSYNLTICPPLVQNIWRQESVDIHFAQNSQISMGLLSYSRNANYKNILKEVKTANVLVIDEAHNYLNLNSRRSQNISQHTSDNIILSTATPINKKAKDLLRLIELLGVDNLNDDELNQFKKLKKLKSLRGIREIEDLREYIKKFIVRRTKKQLKQLILQEPGKYKDKFGNLCQFPETDSQIYQTGETKTDKIIASKINELAQQLRGIIYLRKLEQPEYYLADNEQRYVEIRLKAAKALTIFNVQAKLRSSKVALVELIEGTKAALEHFGFRTSKTASGNVIGTIRKHRDTLPKAEFNKELLPTWLTNLQKYQAECDQEIHIYHQIAKLAKELSDSREISKIREIVKLFKKHKLIIAFDSTIVTLDYLKKIFTEIYPHIECYVVTGKTAKDTALKKFELGSEAENVLGLFSDCMSEGINLQQASTVFFLDMPSVLRIAEQRIGRIDRLDSPHKTIQVFWPLDSVEFALKTDRKLIRTSMTAESLIGSNFDIPDEILNKHMNEIIKPQEMVEALKEAEHEDLMWEGIQDAFKPVHDLYDGDSAIISREDYLYFNDVDASVKVKISILEAEGAWIFLAIRGSKLFSPRWFLIDSDDIIYSELPDVCRILKQKLSIADKTEKNWTEETTRLLNYYLRLLQANEIKLLPNKRRRALEIAQFILGKQMKANKDSSKTILYRKVLQLFQPASINNDYSINYYIFSQQWLDIFNPYLSEKRRNQRFKRKVVSLNDLKQRKEWSKIQLGEETLRQIIENAPYTHSMWQNVAACIIGVPSTDENKN